MITTVNFHLTSACNFKCKFCFGKFNDISKKGLSKKKQFKIIRLLAKQKVFKKINVAGGEPTIVPHICELIMYAKKKGFETSIVTNASEINFKWVKNIAPYLDILTLSIDSIVNETNVASGRNNRNKTVEGSKLIELATACKLFKVNLKVNTVVSKFNQNETIASFINKLEPFRWKIMQVSRVEEQNDKFFDEVMVNHDTFLHYYYRNMLALSTNIKLIKESEKLIQGSYLMIDKIGRFYESTNAKHNYSDSILRIGIDKALEQIFVSVSKFNEREGNYTMI